MTHEHVFEARLRSITIESEGDMAVGTAWSGCACGHKEAMAVSEPVNLSAKPSDTRKGGQDGR